jgi:PAS domain S-box-containing protein
MMKASEEKYRMIFDEAPIGIAISTIEGKIIDVNKAQAEMIGYTVEELKGRSVNEYYVSPDKRLEMIELFKKTGKVRDFEMELKKKDGSIVIELMNLDKVKIEGRDYLFATGRDITDRKRAEKALRESEDKFKYVFDHSVIGKSITLPSGEIHVNNAFCEMLGYTSDELTETKWQDISHPDDIEPTNEALRSLLSGERDSARFIKRYLHKNGSIVWADISTSLRRDDDGNPLYFMTAVIDITEQKQAEESLSFLASRHEAILAAVPDIIMEVDNNKVYTWANKSGFAFFGDNVVGKEAAFYFEGEQLTYKAVQPLFNGGEDTIYVESWQRRRDGKKRLLAWWCRVLKDMNGIVIGALSSAQDITERRLVEMEVEILNEELEQRVVERTEQLEAANKELEAFSYSVSHDLRAPLRSIHSYTNILLEEYEKKLDDEGKRLCGIISSSATQMSGLIDDLLSFSRIGRSDLHLSLIDMKTMVQSILDETAKKIESERIKLKTGKLHQAYGDTTLIGQVWSNLISNAIKYSAKKESPEISIGSQAYGNKITYYVRDNGVGFDMAYKHKLFGVFQRLHSHKEFEGNGVGLAIVQRIIKRHGGDVWAEGEVGKGATFYFSLPVKDISKETHGSRLTTHDSRLTTHD